MLLASLAPPAAFAPRLPGTGVSGPDVEGLTESKGFEAVIFLVESQDSVALRLGLGSNARCDVSFEAMLGNRVIVGLDAGIEVMFVDCEMWLVLRLAMMSHAGLYDMLYSMVKFVMDLKHDLLRNERFDRRKRRRERRGTIHPI